MLDLCENEPENVFQILLKGAVEQLMGKHGWVEKASHVSFVCFSIEMTKDQLSPRNSSCKLGMH